MRLTRQVPGSGFKQKMHELSSVTCIFYRLQRLPLSWTSLKSVRFLSFLKVPQERSERRL